MPTRQAQTPGKENLSPRFGTNSVTLGTEQQNFGTETSGFLSTATPPLKTVGMEKEILVVLTPEQAKALRHLIHQVIAAAEESEMPYPHSICEPERPEDAGDLHVTTNALAVSYTALASDTESYSAYLAEPEPLSFDTIEHLAEVLKALA